MTGQTNIPAVYPPAQQKLDLPRMTVVVVGKRHHTRFYPTTPQNADRSTNCVAGTVVDRGVTEAKNWDFFLQAHSAIQVRINFCLNSPTYVCT